MILNIYYESLCLFYNCFILFYNKLMNIKDLFPVIRIRTENIIIIIIQYKPFTNIYKNMS